MVDRKKIAALHRKYALTDKDFDLIFTHCQAVAEIALWCADNVTEPVDKELLETAALLHDIGSHPFLAAWAYDEKYRNYYVQHALVGAKLLADEGYDEKVCQAVETHPLLGLTKDEIKRYHMIMPDRDYVPTSIEGRLLCYADRFHSKKPIFTTYEEYVRSLTKDFPTQVEKFETWAQEFGVPDVQALAKKYGHPIR